MAEPGLLGEQAMTPSLVLDNGRRIMKLNQVKFIDIGLSSRDSEFNVPAHISGKVTDSLFSWLVEERVKDTGNDMKMLVEEGTIKVFRKFEYWNGFAK